MHSVVTLRTKKITTIISMAKRSTVRIPLHLEAFLVITKILSQDTEITSMKTLRDAILILLGLVLFYILLDKVMF